MIRFPTVRWLGAVIATVLAVGSLAACSSGGGGNSSGGGNITLNVGVFGSFGYKEAGLYDDYMKAHPNIKIVETSPQNESDYWNALQTRLAGGSGLADIQAIEVGRIAGVVANQSSKFVDLNTMPNASTVEANFLAWKLALAQTKSNHQLAMGTDIGPIAMCYRPELLKAAGLPTDSTALDPMMTTWQDYVNLGKQFQAKAPQGTVWTDTGAGLFRAAMGASGDKYTNSSGKIIYQTNPVVASSWKLGVDAIQSGLTTKLTQFSPEWNKAFSTTAFATIPCPAWMLTYIKGQAGDAGNGKWAVTTSPGGGGNVGGAYLAIPTASQHQREAWDLLQFLTSANSEAAVFQKAGNFPSNKGAIDSVKDYKDPYFSNAPTGAILGKTAAGLPTQVIGPKDNDVEGAIMNGLNEIAQKGTSPDKAWSNVQQNIQAAVGG